MWSDNNPDHLPITVLLEPKLWYIPLGGHDFKEQDYINLDKLLREKLGDRLVGKRLPSVVCNRCEYAVNYSRVLIFLALIGVMSCQEAHATLLP